MNKTTPFQSIDEVEFEIDFSMCAPNGKISYTAILNLVQLVAGNHAVKGGFGFAEMAAFDQAWVITQMHLEFEKLPKWQDVILAKTWVRTRHATHSIREMAFYQNDVKLFSISMLWVVFNLKKRTLDELKLDIQHLTIFPDKKATLGEPRRIILPKEMNLIKTYQVLFSDVDMLQHANNIRYLNWVLDTLPYKKLLSNELQSLTLNFANELRIDDKVEIFHQQESEETDFFKIEKEGKLSYAAQLNWKSK